MKATKEQKARQLELVRESIWEIELLLQGAHGELIDVELDEDDFPSSVQHVFNLVGFAAKDIGL